MLVNVIRWPGDVKRIQFNEVREFIVSMIHCIGIYFVRIY